MTMTRDELEARLVAEGFRTDVYGLDGSPPTYEGLSLARSGSRWAIDFVERGARRELESLDDEQRACDRMYELLCKHYPPAQGDGEGPREP